MSLVGTNGLRATDRKLRWTDAPLVLFSSCFLLTITKIKNICNISFNLMKYEKKKKKGILKDVVFVC